MMSEKFRYKRTYANNGHAVWAANHSTDLVDGRGRVVGWHACIHELVYRDTSDSFAAYVSDVPVSELNKTKRFQAVVRSTRNGESFGAIPPQYYFPSLEDAQDYVAITFAKRATEASKKFAKVESTTTEG